MRVLYFCGLLTDRLIQSRALSPSTGSRAPRLLPTLRACRRNRLHAWAVSLGRSRQRGTWRWHPVTVERIQGVPVIYAAYWDCPVFTHFITAFSLALITWRIRKRVASAVFWNAVPHYLLSLLVVRCMCIRCVVDLEDGLREDEPGFKLQRFLLRLWDRWSDAAMVANAQLVNQVKTRPAYPFYGVAPMVPVDRSWEDEIRILFTGYLSKETGVEVLIGALLILKESSPHLLRRFRVIATGFGELSGRMQSAADHELQGVLDFRGQVTDAEYEDLLRSSHIGVCLKMPNHSMGKTTFPSKVIEFSRWGLLVVSCRVSDVPALFAGRSAILLERVTADELAVVIERIVQNPQESFEIARTGQRAIADRLAPQVVAKDLGELWLGVANKHAARAMENDRSTPKALSS